MRTNMHDGFRRGRGRGHLPGHHGEWGAHMPGSPGSGRGGWRGGRGRMRRGDIRTAILAVLTESPGHGYDIMSRLQEKSGGMWRPSAGSVYPTLQQLEDEGLVTVAETAQPGGSSKRVYTATAEGTAEAERRIEEAGGEPWAAERGTGVHPGHLFRSIGTLTMAAKQIVAAGTPGQLAAAVKVTDNARKELYRILGDDDFTLDDDEDTPPVEA
jgi:DNA-binding PadR family transcriptional regulator